MEPKLEERSYPFYIKASAILLALVLLVYILGVLGSVLVPFAMATLLATLLNPFNNLLERRLPKVIAILITIILSFLFVGLILYFLSSQIANFAESIPQLKQKFALILHDLQLWVGSTFGLSMQKQVAMVKDSSFISQGFLTSTLGSVLGSISVMILLPIYIFLLLYYKPLILDFLFQVFKEKYSLRVAEILSQTRSAVQSYMVGLLLETAIVCTLNSIALLIIGVPNAIVIGVIGGILNIIPYLGGLIAIALPVLMATVVSEGFSMQLAVLAAYLVIQFIDNNILVPRIVSSKVKINALVSIIIVLLGGMLWGLSGMFLSIPFIAVLKIIFDRIEELKPWGQLLGDDVPDQHKGVEWQKRWERVFKNLERKKAAK